MDTFLNRTNETLHPPSYRLPGPLPLRLLLPSNVLLKEAKEVQLAELLHRCELFLCNLFTATQLKATPVPNLAASQMATGAAKLKSCSYLTPHSWTVTPTPTLVSIIPKQNPNIRFICQRCNAASTATPGMWPTRRQSLHVLMGNTNLKPGFDKSLNL